MKFSAELIYKSKPMSYMRAHTHTHHANRNTPSSAPWQLSARWEMTFMGRDEMIRSKIEHLPTQSRKDNLEQQFYSRSYCPGRPAIKGAKLVIRKRNIHFSPGGVLCTPKPAGSQRGHLVGNSAGKTSYKKGLYSEGSSESLGFPGVSFFPKFFPQMEALM